MTKKKTPNSIMPHDKEPFVGTVMICNVCEGEFFSKYQGHFAQCPCGECYVDETRYYTRLSGSSRVKTPEEIKE